MENSDSLIGRIIDNKYEIIEKIGEGGDATVYKANQRNLDRIVALKIINESLRNNEDFVNRFIREAKDLAGIEHPNVVRIYDYGRDENLSYIVMELLIGDTLDRVISKNVKLNTAQIISYISPIADALQHIHDKNLIHRDIKSSNIFITTQGRSVLMDFGIAFTSNKTVSIHDLRATPQYMSPEHAAGLKLDGRSDLYSLGVVIFECLTGKVPFLGENITVIIQKVINEIPELPVLISKTTPKWLQNLVMQLLNKKPENRIGTANEVHRILIEQTYREPVKPLYRHFKNSKVMLLGISIVFLIIFLIIMYFLPGKSSDLVTQNESTAIDKSQISLYIEKASGFFNENNYELSHKYYLRVLKIKPGSNEATIKLDICHKKISASLFTDPNIKMPAGTFKMGNPNGGSDEKPVHDVSLSQFEISKFEITNKQYCAFLNAYDCNSEGFINNTKVFLPEFNKTIFYSDDLYKLNSDRAEFPVYGVTWYGAAMFCRVFGGRLPTEAEWEYCAQGSTPGYVITGNNSADETAWFSKNSSDQTHKVGSKKPNQAGIFDMNGNVWEWCFDNYQPAYYSISMSQNPQGPASGTSKVIRGGDCTSPPNILRSAYRSNADVEGNTGDYIGFRIVFPL